MGGDCWREGVYQAEGSKGRKFGTTVCNIINKIYLKNCNGKYSIVFEFCESFLLIVEPEGIMEIPEFSSVGQKCEWPGGP